MNLISEDVDRFWELWPRVSSIDSSDAAQVLEDEYLGTGTVGLQDFWNLRIESGRQLAGTIGARPRFYDSIKDIGSRAQSQIQKIEEACSKLNSLLDGAVTIDTYLLIGRMNSAGTVSQRGLLIGLEMMGRTPSTPIDELTHWHQEVLAPIEKLPALVLHEYVHANQQTSQPRSLLAEAIVEGTADFIVSLLLGPHDSVHHVYGLEHEQALWAEFTAEMHKPDFSNWLGQGDSAKERPADLGYFIGHQICAAYFSRQDDPRQAAKSMLSIEDFEKFLEDSGYDGTRTEVVRYDG